MIPQDITSLSSIWNTSPAARAWRSVQTDLSLARMRLHNARASIVYCDLKIEECEDRRWRSFATTWRARRAAHCVKVARAQHEIAVCLIAQYYLARHETLLARVDMSSTRAAGHHAQGRDRALARIAYYSFNN